MKGIILMLVVILSAQVTFAQQTTPGNKYIFDGLYITPSYSGYKQDLFVEAFYKSQWTGFTGAPTSFSLAADGLIGDSKVGLGAIISSNTIGAQSNLSAYGNYAYHIRMDGDEDSDLSFGLGFGFIQSGIDGTKLNATDNSDNTIPNDFQSVLVPDSRVGVMYSNSNFYVGISTDNMIAHYFKKFNSIYEIIPKPSYYLTAGALLTLNDEMKLKPSFLFSDNQNGPKALDLNMFVLFGDRFWLGGTYRSNIAFNKSNINISDQNTKGIAAMVQMVLNDNIHLGYSFDYSMSPLGNSNYGTHEVSVGFLFKSKKGYRDHYF